MASSGKTSVKFGKDPLSDRRASMEAMKSCKGSMPKAAFKEGKVRESHDEFYSPHKGKVKK